MPLRSRWAVLHRVRPVLQPCVTARLQLACRKEQRDDGVPSGLIGLTRQSLEGTG